MNRGTSSASLQSDGTLHVARENLYIGQRIVSSAADLRVKLEFHQPSSKIFLLTVPRRSFFCGAFMLSLSCFLCFRTRLFIDALWPPVGKGLTSWLLFVKSNCEVVTFPCGILGDGVVLDCINS